MVYDYRKETLIGSFVLEIQDEIEIFHFWGKPRIFGTANDNEKVKVSELKGVTKFDLILITSLLEFERYLPQHIVLINQKFGNTKKKESNKPARPP